MVKRWLVAALVAAFSIAVTPALSWSHPLHTTLGDVTIDADGSLRLTLRAFADDFSTAAARHGGKPRTADVALADRDVESYVAATVVFRDARGRNIPLVWAGVRRTGDLMWITVRAPGVRSLTGLRVTYSTLFDAFSDQVNILQSNDKGRRHTVLFTASDGPVSKPIL